MALKAVGAGLGRTGTHSLKLGLERLLGAPCYHMVEVFSHPAHVPQWKAAATDQPVDWEFVMNGYAAAVDWPACSFWRELSALNPHAPIIYSRRDPEAWWESANATIFSVAPQMGGEMNEWHDMVVALFERKFTGEIKNRDACIAAFKRHEADVLENAPSDRLVVWNVSDGWGPLCEALHVPVPEEPFPKTNTREQFLAHHQETSSQPADQPVESGNF